MVATPVPASCSYRKELGLRAIRAAPGEGSRSARSCGKYTATGGAPLSRRPARGGSRRAGVGSAELGALMRSYVGHGPVGGLRVASGSTDNATTAGASAAVAAAARLAPGRSAPTAAPKRNRARVW